MKFRLTKHIASVFLTVLILFYLILFQNVKNYFKINQLIEYNDDFTLNLTAVNIINLEFDVYLKFNLKPLNLCQTVNSSLLLAYVMINVDNYSKRQSIRRTWANSTLFPNLRVAFVIGLSNEINSTEKLANEQSKYNDLIQGNFVDTYRNLTYKSLTAWKWITRHCSSARLIVKIDDDLALNSRNLINYFQTDNKSVTTTKMTSNSFYCNVCVKGAPHRHSTSKWRATYDEYNEKLYGKGFQNMYPTFCYGPAYIMTPDLIGQMYFYSKYVKFFWLEDIYTALLARHIENVTFNQIVSKYIYKSNLKSNSDFFFVRDANTNDDFNKIMNYIKK